MAFDAPASGHYITAADVLTLRKEIFGDNLIDRDEVAKLMAMGNTHPNGDKEWSDFFVEALTDFFLKEEYPAGYLTDEEFSFIRHELLGHDDVINALEFQALIGLQKRATQTPLAMSRFILDHFRIYILSKGGYPVMDEADTYLLKTALYAMGGDKTIGISRDEANFVFELNRLTEENGNCEAWLDLFKKSISAHLMAYCGVTPMAREDALALGKWEMDSKINIGSFFSRMFDADNYTVDPKSVAELTAEKAEHDENMRTISAQITMAEASWFWKKLSEDNKISASELALLRHLKFECRADLPENIDRLIT